jgi:hypothetical protein
MSCPTNQYGTPMCNVVQHPDHPEESFCASCERRFQNQNAATSGIGTVIIAIIAALLGLIVMTSDTSPQRDTQPSSQGTVNGPISSRTGF